MTFKLRPKALFKFLWRLRRKSRHNLWQFGLAVREVMAARMLLAMTGELSAAEARRMVEEKQLAVVRAQFGYTGAILSGEGASAWRLLRCLSARGEIESQAPQQTSLASRAP